MARADPFGAVREQVAHLRGKGVSGNKIAARMGVQAIDMSDAIRRTDEIAPQTGPLRDKVAVMREYHGLYLQAAGELDGRLEVTALTRREES